MNAATKILEALLRRGDVLETLTQEHLSAILPILEDAHNAAIGLVAKGGWSKEWLDELAGELDDLYKEAARRAYKTAKPGLEKIASDEGAWIGAEAQRIAVGVPFSIPAPSLLAALVELPTSIGGSTLEQLFESLGVNSREAVYTAVARGMVAGNTIGDMTRRLRGEVVTRAKWARVDGKRRYIPGVYKGGAVEDVSTRQAEMLARTAVIHVANAAREVFYTQNEDLIKGYQCVETLDMRTCLVCGWMDGQVFDPDAPRISQEHPDCRRAWVPVLKSWRELGIDRDEVPEGTRASMDGQVAASTTYADKLKAMTAAQRVKALGPGRAALYEKGVPLSDMVRDGKAIPLKELA